MRADLHVHTYFSDGLLSPQQVVATAAQNGVKLLAVTDHDCALAYGEARASGEKYGVEILRGTEISAYEGDIKLHTLAYGFDPENKEVKNFFERLRRSSLERTEEILFKLNAVDVKLNLKQVEEQRFCVDSPLHSMHIARAAVKRGYASNAFEFYKNFFMRGKPAFCKKGRPTPEQTLRIFTAAGGFCSLAHPGRVELDRKELNALILRLKDEGLCGIEAVYSTHTKEQTTYFKEFAKKSGLLITGGSDTHFAEGNNKIGYPFFEPEPDLLQKIHID